jgi:UDP-N-acetylglucosamine 2-epimerase
LFSKDLDLELVKTYVSHFFSNSVPTDEKNDKKKFMKRGRFFLYKFLFLLKTQKKSGWNIFKIIKYFFILIKAHLTIYQDLHDPRFSCDVNFVETQKLVKKLENNGYDKKKLVVTGIPMYDSAIKQIQKFEKNKKNKKINVLFLTHAMYEHGIWTKNQRNDLVRNVITELTKHKNKFAIKVKIHPSSELISDYESLIHPIDESIEIIQKGDILENIMNSDIIITYSGASSLVYALMGKKPIIVCNFYNLKNDIFVDRKVVTECKSECEVISKIFELNKNKSINEQSINQFIEDYFYKLDGKASERISNEIMKIIRNKK